MSTTIHPIRIMGKYEAWHLGLPVFFVIVTLVSCILDIQFSNDDVANGNFVQRIIFFNSTHTVFTFLFLGVAPEGRLLLHKAWIAKRKWIFAAVALVVLFPIFFYFKIAKRLDPLTIMILFALPNYWFYRHSSGQSRGLAGLYSANATSVNSDAPCENFKLKKKLERFCFQILILGIVIRSFQKDITTLTGFTPPSLTLQGLIVLATFCILAIAFSYRGPAWRNKRIFSLRILLYPMIFYSPIAKIAVGATHGIEYFFTSITMLERSSIKKSHRAAYFVLSIAYLFAIPSILAEKNLRMPQHIYDYLPEPSNDILITLVVACATIENLHYFVDRHLFRMSDPIVAETIGPLLKDLPRSA